MKRVKSIVQVTSALLIMTGIIHTTMVIKNVAPNFPAEILQSGAYVLMVLGTLAFIALSKKSLRDVGLFCGHFVRQLIVGGVIGGIFWSPVALLQDGVSSRMVVPCTLF